MIADKTKASGIELAGVKSAIQKAATAAQSGIAKTETAAIAATDRIESGVETMKAQFEGAKAIGNELIDVVDNAGRTAIGSVVAINGSLVTYGREAINDTIDTGRKTFEVTSFKDAVDLHTAYTERRLKAMFNTMSALTSLAQTNTMAMWSPLADMLRAASTKGDDAVKASTR